MELNRAQWERVLIRWCDLQATPEVRLTCAVIADGIVDREKLPWFFERGCFDAWCRVIGLDTQFVLEQIQRAGEFVPDGLVKRRHGGYRPKGSAGLDLKPGDRVLVINQVDPALNGAREVGRAQEDIGPGSYFFRNRKTGERFGLKDLPPDAGRHDEPLPAFTHRQRNRRAT